MRELSPLEARLSLASNGYSPIPVNGKIPHIRGWQQWHHRDAEVIHLWERGYSDHRNTSLLTRDNPFLDLDLYDQAAAEAARDLVLDKFDGHIIPLRIGNAPKHGFLFQIAGPPFAKIMADLVGPDGRNHRIEFLCDGNQVVVHGIHPDIHRPYSWHGGSPFEIRRSDLAGMTAQEAQSLVEDIIAMLIRNFEYQRPQQPKPNGSAQPADHDWGNCLSHLDSHDHDTAFAMKLVRSGMSAGAAINFGREMIARYGNDSDPARVRRRIDEWPRAVNSAKDKVKEPAPAPAPLAPQSYADLKGETFMPLQYVVPQFIPEGLTLLAGKPKLGKSCLALAITMAAARGDDVLNQRCAPCDVLYCALEDTPRRMQDRASKILGSGEDWPHNAWAVYELPPLDKGCIETLQKYLDAQPTIKLIIIDTLINIRGKRAKGDDPYAADYATMKALWDFAHKTNINVIVIHHVRKAASEDLFDTISGTLGLNGGADTLIVLTKKTKDDPIRMAVRGRDLDEQDKIVDFDYDMGAWDVLGDYETEDNPISKTRDIIKSTLAGSPSPMSPAQIASGTGLTESTVRGTLRRMNKDGDIKRTAYGAYHI
jgi:hypothetical protein